MCVGRARARRAEASSGSVASGADVAGPSGLTSRAATYGEEDGATRFLPDFFLGSYEDFVRTCERNAKIGCVVLVSEEHDDVPEFKRYVSSYMLSALANVGWQEYSYRPDAAQANPRQRHFSLGR